MRKNVSIILAILILFASCKPYENSINLAPTHPPVVRKDITFSYSADQLNNPNNHIKKGWANRNNIQVLQISVINNSDKAIHGSQLRFYANNQQLEIADHTLASKKLRTKKFPAAVYIIPVVLVGVVIYAALTSLVEDDADRDGFSDDTLPLPEKSEAKDPLYGANLLQKGLYNFNIAQQIIRPGEKITGFIAFKSKPQIEELNIEIIELDYEVLKY